MPPSDYESQHDRPVSTGTETVDEGTQSEPDSLVLELKLQNIILQRENTKLKSALEEQQQATQDKEQQQQLYMPLGLHCTKLENTTEK